MTHQRSKLTPSLKRHVDIVFVGERPGKRSLETRCYYADPRNSFWRDLKEAGLTPRRFEPCEYSKLLDLSPSIALDDLYEDAPGLLRRLLRAQPKLVVLNSRTTFRKMQRDEAGREVLDKFEHVPLDDSSGQARRWRARRLEALRALRARFPSRKRTRTKRP